MTLPEHIDVSNADQVREELLTLINRGAVTLIADTTATLSCDRAGADAVARARKRAAVSGTQLRLVVAAEIVSRVLSIEGLDRPVSSYPSLEAAIARTSAQGIHPVPPVAIPARGDGPAPPRPDAQAMRKQKETVLQSGLRATVITPNVLWPWHRLAHAAAKKMRRRLAHAAATWEMEQASPPAVRSRRLTWRQVRNQSRLSRPLGLRSHARWSYPIGGADAGSSSNWIVTASLKVTVVSADGRDEATRTGRLG